MKQLVNLLGWLGTAAVVVSLALRFQHEMLMGGIAIDKTRGHLYVVETRKGEINVLNLNGAELFSYTHQIVRRWYSPTSVSMTRGRRSARAARTFLPPS